MGDEYFYALGRNDKLFCHDCYRYVIAILDHAANEPLYFSLKFNVDRGTRLLCALTDRHHSSGARPDHDGDGDAGQPRTGLHHRPAQPGIRHGHLSGPAEEGPAAGDAEGGRVPHGLLCFSLFLTS